MDPKANFPTTYHSIFYNLGYFTGQSYGHYEEICFFFQVQISIFLISRPGRHPKNFFFGMAILSRHFIFLNKKIFL